LKSNPETGISKPFALIYFLVISSQMVSLAFGRIDQSVSLSSIIIPSLVFLSVFTIPSIWIGLVLHGRVGFSLLPSQEVGRCGKFGVLSASKASSVAILFGVMVGGLLLVIRHYSMPYLPPEIPPYGFRGVVGGLAVSLGAAVAEEAWFRLGLMTFLVWVLTKIFRSGEVNSSIVWFVIVISALAFGLVHIPQLLSYGAGSLFAVSGTILGNLVVGLLYGWCYWKLGLSSAMLAHFSVDIVIHVLQAL
jgi:hypothetical protein